MLLKKRNIAFVIVILCLLVACVNEEPQFSRAKMTETGSGEPSKQLCKSFALRQGDRLGVLMHKIDSVNAIFLYGRNKQAQNHLRTPEPAQQDSSLNQRERNNQIFMADAMAFATGILWGGIEGVACGTAVFPGLGSAVGGVLDGVVAGLSLAMVASVSAAKAAYCVAIQNSPYAYWEISDLVIYNDAFLFSDDIAGANLGWYHNAVIQEIWNNAQYADSVGAIFDNILAYFEDNSFCEYTSRENIRDSLSQYWRYGYTEGLLNFWCYYDYQQVVGTYVQTMEQLCEEEYLVYSQSIMEEISSSDLLEEDKYVLNGTISTFYYSSVLWNMDAIENYYYDE